MARRSLLAGVLGLGLVACASPRGVAPARATAPRLARAVRATKASAPVAPESSPSDAALERAVAAAAEGAIARGEVPGAVVVVALHGEVVLRKAYGAAALEPKREPMRLDTLFDLASLTKPLVTAISVMQLAHADRIKLDDAITAYLPELADTERGVTVAELLLHTSGLPADTALDAWRGGRASAIARALATPLEAAPGARTRYSDVGFVILGALVERVSGQRLDVYARANIFAPLGLRDAAFVPTAELVARAAPTERRDGAMLRGVVHDPRAAAMDGVAGHAGLFATADDVVKIGLAIANGGAPILDRASVEAMLRPRTVPGGARALGWDLAPSLSSRAGATAVSHTGFTGTWLMIDRPSGVVAAVFTSRLHPNGGGDAKPIRREVAAAIRAWVRAESDGRVNGLDVLEREGFARLADRRVGLVTNDAAIDRDGVGAFRRFSQAKSIRLARVFTPEHGLAARADGRVADGRDPATGVPIVSLYGARTKPAPADLADLDVLVVDLPSVGARFYTYVTTIGLVLEAASAAKLPVVVLDRAPLGGAGAIEGPLLDDALRSFTGYARLPIRFGMTNGELARYFVATERLAVDLEVVAIERYRRGDLGDEHDAAFVPPSPNLRSVDAALLYPGVALLERANVSVGRGTDTPFERVGAPWIDAAAWAAALERERLRGVRVAATAFVPREGPFAGRRCQGVAIEVIDRRALAPVELGLGLIRALHRSHPAAFKLDEVLPMLGNRRAFEALAHGATVEDVTATFRTELEAFRKARAEAILYAN